MLIVMYNLVNLYHQIVINSIPYLNLQQNLVVNKNKKILSRTYGHFTDEKCIVCAS